MRVNVNAGLPLGKATFNKKTIFASKLDLNLRKKLVKSYIWSIALCGADTTALRKVDRKYVESFEVWRWRRVEKISWTDRVRNEELLRTFKEERDILRTITRRKTNWVSRIFSRKCLPRHVTEVKVEERTEVPRRRRRRRWQELYNLKEKRGS